MRLLIFALLISAGAYGQSTYFIRADSVRFQKTGGSTTFILENATRAKTGAYLRNRLDGRTDFYYAVDSASVSGSNLILWRGGGTQNITVGIPASSGSWLTTGNSGTTAGTNFVGTTDAVDLVFKTNGTERARWGSTGAYTGTVAGAFTINQSTTAPIVNIATNGTDTAMWTLQRGSLPSQKKFQTYVTLKAANAYTDFIQQSGNIQSNVSVNNVIVGSVHVGDEFVSIEALRKSDNNWSRIHWTADSALIAPAEGKLNIDSLRTWSVVGDTTYKKPMTWDTRNGRWEYTSNWFGGGGGGGSQTPWTSNINGDGFTLYGNDGANEDLTLEGTSHATKTTSYVIIQPTAGNVGIGTTTPVGSLSVERNNTDYINTGGANSHVFLNNPNASGQTTVYSMINGAAAAKWRTDNVKNINWVSYADNSAYGHNFWIDGDYDDNGTVKMLITNSGVSIGSWTAPVAATSATEALHVTGNIRFSGALMPNNLPGTANDILKSGGSGAPPIWTSQAALFATFMGSGTYTPTLTNTANLDASTAYVFQYSWVKDPTTDLVVVTVSGRVDVDPTTTLTDTQLSITVPVNTNFTNAQEAGGTGNSTTIAAQSAGIKANTSGNTVIMQWRTTDVTNQPMFLTFTYKVTPP